MSAYSEFQLRMHRLSIRARLFSIVLAFAIPMLVLIYFTIDNISRNIKLTVMEREGLQYEIPLIKLLSEVANHRLTRMQMATGEEKSAEYAIHEKNIDGLLEEIAEIDKKLGADLKFTNEGLNGNSNNKITVDDLKKDWMTIKTHNSDNREVYSGMFQAISNMITNVGGASGLILDPDLDSYYMMDISVNHLPRSIRRISDVTFILYPKMVFGGEILEETRGEARVAERFLREAEFESVLFAMESALNEDKNFYGISTSLRPNMEPIIASYKQKMERLAAVLHEIANGNRIDADDFINTVSDARDFFVVMNFATLKELDSMLVARIDFYKQKQLHTLIWYGVAQAIGLLLFFLLTTSVTTPINRLYKTIVAITAGNLNVAVPGKEFHDEIGQIARGIESFRINALEKVRLETALKAEGDYLQSVMDSSVDGIIVTSDMGFILNFNRAAEKMFGYGANEIMGKNISVLMSHDSPLHDNKRISDYLHNLDSGTSGARKEVEGQRKDGRVFPMEMALSLLVHDDSEIYFVGLLKDITERKTMEAELIEHRDHLQKLVNMQTIDLIIEKEKAEQATIAKSEFLSNMSHELRTPMHAILNYADMGMKIVAENEPKLRKYLNNIHTAGTRLLGLLNSLLDFEKLEAGKMEFNLKQGDFAKVIDYAEAELDSLVKAKGQRIAKIYMCKNTSALFDEVRMIQVLINLLSNAIKFAPENSVITITLADEFLPDKGGVKAGLLCKIEDEGMGIPEGELESVFDKFTQSSKTKTSAGGTGLGLSISRKIIENHGGKIWAENGKAKGTVISFILPRG